MYLFRTMARRAEPTEALFALYKYPIPLFENTAETTVCFIAMKNPTALPQSGEWQGEFF